MVLGLLIYINGPCKPNVFGGDNGSYLASIEEWDEDSEMWKTSTMKLSEKLKLSLAIANFLNGFYHLVVASKK